MKERPILFSSPMVRALLAGTKTQTRRVVKPQPPEFDHATRQHQRILVPRCPYGQPGDRLWVRETCRAEELPSGLGGVRYLADDAFIEIENSEDASERWGVLAGYGMKKSGLPECRVVPSIHVPRWASRILLEITAVRVERLQDISEADAMAEVISEVTFTFRPDDGFPLCNGYMVGADDGKTPLHVSSKAAYHELWEQINGAGSWEANPLVWVIEFRRIEA